MLRSTNDPMVGRRAHRQRRDFGDPPVGTPEEPRGRDRTRSGPTRTPVRGPPAIPGAFLRASEGSPLAHPSLRCRRFQRRQRRALAAAAVLAPPFCRVPKTGVRSVASSVRRVSGTAVSPPETTSPRNRGPSAAFSCGVVISPAPSYPPVAVSSQAVAGQANQSPTGNKYYLYDIKVGLVTVSQ